MKRLLAIYLFFSGPLHAEESYISRGGLTEALFIIQNKHNELSDYIGRLKRMVTQCLMVYKEKTRRPELTHDMRIYHCSFKEKLFSASIKELEELLDELHKSLLDLSKKEQFTHSFVQSHVERAFLIKRKIDTESLLIEHFLKVRRIQDSLKQAEKSLEHSLHKCEDLKKDSSNAPRSHHTLRRMERHISFLTRARGRLQVDLEKSDKAIKNSQKILSTIDKELYKEYKGERVNVLVEEKLA